MLCNLCNISFEDRHSYSNHQKYVHQAVVRIGTLTISRGSDGMFECPRHGSTGRSAQFARDHARCFRDFSRPESTSEDLEPDQSDTSSSDSILDRFDLGYDGRQGYLFCKVCKGVLSVSFQNHIRKVHNLKISSAEAESIRSAFHINSFQIDFDSIHAPFLYLRTLEGFKCQRCMWKGLTRKSVDAHLRSNSFCSTFEECLLQSACIGNSKRYFQVLASEQQSLTEEHSWDQIIWNSTEILRSQERPLEDFRTRRQFFTDRGWFIDPQEARVITERRMVEFSECPTIFAADNDTISTWIIGYFNSVKDWDVHYRYKLSSEGHMFRYLQTNDSRTAYARAMIDLLYFSINLLNHPVDFYYTASVSILQAKVRFERLRTKDSLVDFLYQLGMEPLVSTTRSSSCVMTFLRVSCLLPNGALLTEERIGQNAARIVYIIKMVYYIYYREGPGRWDDFERNLGALHGDGMNVPASVFMLLKDAKKAAFEQRSPIAIFETRPGFEINFFGKLVRYDKFPLIVQASRSKISRLKMQLSVGLVFADIDTGKVIDDFSNRDSDYGMVYNATGYSKRYIIESICRNETLRGQFLNVEETVETGRLVWRSDAVKRYLKIYDLFIEELAFFIHLTSGMPARATELETYTIRNTASSQRSVFLKGKKLFFYATYSKTNNMSSSRKRICRFLDEAGTLTLLFDLFYLRPFISVLARSESQNDNNVYYYFLFVKNGQKMTAAQIRMVFAEKFIDYGSLAITFQEFRHLAKHISLKLLKAPPIPEAFEDVGSDDEGEGEVGHISTLATAWSSQLGHTRGVAHKRYAVTMGDQTDVDNYDLSNFELCSSLWQSFLETGRLSARMGNTSTTSESPIVTAPIRQQIMEVVVDPILVVPDSKLKFPDCASKVQSEQSLEALRRVYDDPSANFRSREQHYAIKQVLYTTNNMLVVLPTGCGKSLLFFLDAYQNNHKTVLVVLPTRALVSDVVKRAREHGISYCLEKSMFRGEKMLVATTDVATSSEYLFFLQGLANQKKLSKIFVDEAHCYVTDSQYRQSMSRLKFLLTVSIPMILLTATAPRWIESILIHEFFRYGGGQVIRSTTNRPNICYSVETICNNEREKEKIEQLYIDMREDDRMIIYFSSISVLEHFSVFLDRRNIQNCTYHSDLPPEARDSSFSRWISGPTKIMLSTTAFGVGVDYPHVRVVVIYGLPFTFEDYVQMCGRAGRDGQPSKAILFFKPGYEEVAIGRMTDKARECKELMLAYAKSNSCRRELISSYMDGSATTCYLDASNSICDKCCIVAEPSSYQPNTQEAHSSLQYMATAQIQSSINESSIENNRIFALLVKLKTICPICFVRDRLQKSHPIHRCLYMHRICIRCLGLDQTIVHNFSSSCPTKDWRPSARNACFKCFFPQEIGGREYHRNSECPHDFVYPYVLALYKFRAIDIEFRGSFQEYLGWLEQPSGRMQNISNMILELLEYFNL